jgi:hypothetical protein
MELIRFETFQAITFVLASSMFLFFMISWIKWIVRQMGKTGRPARR